MFITDDCLFGRVSRPIVSSLLFATALSLTACQEMPEQNDDQPERPNILLFLADDATTSDFGFAGGQAHTPRIDGLASQGSFFNSFHASPVCSVTRSMVLTGNNPVEVGLGTFDYAVYPEAADAEGYETYLTRNTVAISELLQDAGYFTAMVGKWHLGGKSAGGQGPHEWGFDRTYAILSGGANHWNSGVSLPHLSDPEEFAMAARGEVPLEHFYENGLQVERPDGVYSDTLWTDKLLEYLDVADEQDKPFFAYVAYTTPHGPIQAPANLIDKYVDYYLELGYEGVKKARWQEQKNRGMIPADAPLPDWGSNPLVQEWQSLSDEDKERQARIAATYTAMLESQDQHVGKVLDYLAETGRLDNTLIVYMSDNGPEGQDDSGPLANPDVARWVTAVSPPELESIGGAENYAFLGTEWANAATGGLSWWKWFIGEGGVRVPLIIVPPAATQFAHAGALVDGLVSVKDVPATILDYAGVTHPQAQYEGRAITRPSGVSLQPFLAGVADTPRSADQWDAFELFGNGYVLAGNYKAMYVRRGMWGDGEWHLFDILNDPGETQPLETERPEQLQAMVEFYQQYTAERNVVPVRANWNPWHGFVDNDGPCITKGQCVKTSDRQH